MGDGFTLNANHSAQGLGEVAFNNRQIQSTDVLIPLNCSGGGFNGPPGFLSILVRVFDSFELYADGVLVANSTPGCHGDDEVVNIPTTTNLIGVHGMALSADPGNGILATVGNKAVSNASWYCHKGFDVSWTKFGYNFLTWPHAFTHAQEDSSDADLIQQSPLAQYIWTPATLTVDQEVYCIINLKSYTPAPVVSEGALLVLDVFPLLVALVVSAVL